LIGVSFAATLKSTGSLLQAILLLPDAWETLREPLAEIFGDQNELFNTIARYYNFVSENEKVLAGLTGIGTAMEALFSVNLLTTAQAEAMGAAWVSSFEKMIADGADFATLIALMGGEAIDVGRIFTAMGIEIPEALQAVIDAAVEAGHSMEPPATVETILGNIQTILEEIARFMGIVIELGPAFAGALTGGGPADPSDPKPKPPDPGDTPLAAGLAPTVFTKPTGLTVGDAGPEMVQAVPLGDIDGAGMAGGGGPTINITFQGPVFGDEESFYSAVRESVNEGLRHNHDDLRTETRLATS